MISEGDGGDEGGRRPRYDRRRIHPYPTQAEALRKLANQLRRARFSAGQKRLLSRWFAWRR